MPSWQIREPTPDDAAAVCDVLVEASIAAWGDFVGADRIRAANAGADHPASLVAADGDGVFDGRDIAPLGDRTVAFYERRGWRREGPPRVRDWHGVRLCEPRYVKDL